MSKNIFTTLFLGSIFVSGLYVTPVIAMDETPEQYRQRRGLKKETPEEYRARKEGKPQLKKETPEQYRARKERNEKKSADYKSNKEKRERSHESVNLYTKDTPITSYPLSMQPDIIRHRSKRDAYRELIQKSQEEINARNQTNTVKRVGYIRTMDNSAPKKRNQVASGRGETGDVAAIIKMVKERKNPSSSPSYSSSSPSYSSSKHSFLDSGYKPSREYREYSNSSGTHFVEHSDGSTTISIGNGGSWTRSPAGYDID